MTGCKMLMAAVVGLAMVAMASGRAAALEHGFLTRVYQDDQGQQFKYVVFVPQDYQGDKPYPLILFLHGLGESGTNGKAQAGVGLGDAVKKREKTFPFIVVFPQAARASKPYADTWKVDRPEGKKALAILAEVEKNYKVDPKRIYLTGLSMGGFGTWAMATALPDKWAAMVPICGGGDPEQAGKIKDIPCWCFHGDADDVVKVEESRRMIAALKAAGGKPRYSELARYMHNSWDRAYDSPELYEWLLQQHK